LLGPGLSFSLLITVGRTPMDGGSARRTAQTQNERPQTSMPPMGFELTISVLEQAKAVHAASGITLPQYVTICKYIFAVFKWVSVSTNHLAVYAGKFTPSPVWNTEIHCAQKCSLLNHH
jgi:hypothetical protein